MRAINIWAWQEGLPAIQGFQRDAVCSDGSGSADRLGGGGSYLVGSTVWHVGLPFSSLQNLAQQLGSLTLPDHISGEPRRLQRGELQTLAIDCHGTAGMFFPNGLAHGREVSLANLRQFRDALRGIGLMTASQAHQASEPVPPRRFPRAPTEFPASTIIIMACNTGAGTAGSRLLTRLSLEWPGRNVVAFSSTVVYPNLRRTTDASGAQCVPPFALDSGESHLRGEELTRWTQATLAVGADGVPARLPMADATADNAKIACDGEIIRVPLNEQTRASAAPRGRLARRTASPQALGRAD